MITNPTPLQLNNNSIADKPSLPQPPSKALEIFKRFIGNPLAMITIEIASLATLHVISAQYPNFLNQTQRTIISQLGLAILGLTAYVCRKVLPYQISIIHTLSNHYFFPKTKPWWTPIIDNKIVLGGIPLKNYGHLEQIKSIAHSVLSLIEPFERETFGWFSVPVQLFEWTAVGLNCHTIETPDFKPMSLEDIKEGVRFIREENEHNRCVYAHCKAGRGRSTTVVVCYLLTYWNELFPKDPLPNDPKAAVEKVIAFVKQKRPVINLNPRQRQAIDDYARDVLSLSLKPLD